MASSKIHIAEIILYSILFHKSSEKVSREIETLLLEKYN